MNERRLELRWAKLAVTGMITGLSACSQEPAPQVPGAPTADPAGAPAAQLSTDARGGSGEKMSCSAAMGMESADPEPDGGATKMACSAGMKMK